MRKLTKYLTKIIFDVLNDREKLRKHNNENSTALITRLYIMDLNYEAGKNFQTLNCKRFLPVHDAFLQVDEFLH